MIHRPNFPRPEKPFRVPLLSSPGFTLTDIDSVYFQSVLIPSTLRGSCHAFLVEGYAEVKQGLFRFALGALRSLGYENSGSQKRMCSVLSLHRDLNYQKASLPLRFSPLPYDSRHTLCYPGGGAVQWLSFAPNLRKCLKSELLIYPAFPENIKEFNGRRIIQEFFHFHYLPWF